MGEHYQRQGNHPNLLIQCGNRAEHCEEPKLPDIVAQLPFPWREAISPLEGPGVTAMILIRAHLCCCHIMRLNHLSAPKEGGVESTPSTVSQNAESISSHSVSVSASAKRLRDCTVQQEGKQGGHLGDHSLLFLGSGKAEGFCHMKQESPDCGIQAR